MNDKTSNELSNAKQSSQATKDEIVVVERAPRLQGGVSARTRISAAAKMVAQFP
jgi:hypothetical protein